MMNDAARSRWKEVEEIKRLVDTLTHLDLVDETSTDGPESLALPGSLPFKLVIHLPRPHHILHKHTHERARE